MNDFMIYEALLRVSTNKRILEISCRMLEEEEEKHQ